MKEDQASADAKAPATISLQIADLLKNMLRKGLEVTEDVLFFMESTYGVPPAELESVAIDPLFEDRHIVINQLFSPTQQMRENLEPLLAEGHLAEDDIRQAGGRIIGEISEIRLHMPGGSSFPWAVGGEEVIHFVEKFYMDRQLDPFIAPVLQKQLPEKIAIPVKVFMRCRNLSFSGEARRFMLMCIERAVDRAELFKNTAEVLLTLASQAPPQVSIIEYLHEQREYQKKRLCDIDDFSKKAERYGLEYLLMQNYPIPHESEENVSALLRQYDMIIDELLDLQNPREHYVIRRDLGTFDSSDDLEKLFRSLS